MADRDTVTQLGRLFGAVARDHHEATGGTNPDWARWYADHLLGQVDELVGYSPDVDEIESWLIEADRLYRAESPESRWPFFYAELILDRLAVPPQAERWDGSI
jgi:hypothetical protein